MNAVERMLYEQMTEEVFQRVASDDFSFVDSLIDQHDLDKISKEEDR